jgi:Putative metallopeptidase
MQPFTTIVFAALALLAATVHADVVVRYPPAQKPDLQEIQQDWKKGELLEGFGSSIDRMFILNDTLTLVGAECHQPNAYYMPDRKAIVLCLELVPYLADPLIRELGRSVPRERLAEVLGGAVAFVMLHEIGHALIHLFNLPILGREEDAADQISTFFILSEEKFSVQGINGALYFFRNRPLFFTRQHLSGEHGLAPQRRANIACWAYGKDSARFEWALRVANVSQDRAVRCQQEYKQLDASVRKLLQGRLR